MSLQKPRNNMSWQNVICGLKMRAIYTNLKSSQTSRARIMLLLLAFILNLLPLWGSGSTSASKYTKSFLSWLRNTDRLYYWESTGKPPSSSNYSFKLLIVISNWINKIATSSHSSIKGGADMLMSVISSVRVWFLILRKVCLCRNGSYGVKEKAG